MFSYLLAVLLAVIVLLAVMLRKVYSVLPSKELKRRAETGDPLAVQLWRAVAYGASLRVFLWLIIILGSGLCFVLLGQIAPPVFGFIAVSLLLYTAFAWLPKSDMRGVEARLAFTLTPAVAWMVGNLDPVLGRIHKLTHRKSDGHVHTGVYIRQDLIDLIEQQKSQPDNELSIEELTIASTALGFGDKKVRDLLTKRKQVHSIDAASDISPVFLDELHKTMHSRFPVYETEPDNIVGTLYLGDLTGVGSGKGVRGKVRNRMSPGVVFVHEADSLADALHAFYLTKRQLFVVVNKFEEYVGIITIEDILHALLGKPGEYEFDQHESRSAVAARHTKKPKAVDHVIDETAIEPVPVPEDPETPDEAPDEIK